MSNTFYLLVLAVLVLNTLNGVSAITVTNVKNSTTTNLHRCKLFTACRQIKASFSGGTVNPYFCAYTHNGQFECPMTSAPPALPALIDSNCRTLVEQKSGITALDEFMYLSTAEIENEVACVAQLVNSGNDFTSWFNNLFGISSHTTRLSASDTTNIVAPILCIFLSALATGVP